MTTHLSIIDQFVSLWGRKDNPVLATKAEIDEVENSLSMILPESYKYMVQKYGDVYTPNILDTIVEKNVELVDVQNFSLPKQAAEDTMAYEKAGMPGGHFAFASDCMGNLFCFRIDECKEISTEPSIWFFDHDFVTMDKAYNNFYEWLNNYLKL
jgi:hypothetical protein